MNTRKVQKHILFALTLVSICISSAIAVEDDHDGEDPHDEHDHEHDDEHGKPWGKMFGFTLLVNVATLSGVLFLVPFISKQIQGRKLFDIAIPSFASGALLALSVFIVIPEALYEIMAYMKEHGEEEDTHAGHDHRFLAEDGEEEAHDDHAGEIPPSVIWRFGSALLGGFMIPMLFALITPHKQANDVETTEKVGSDIEQAQTSKKYSDLNYPLIYSIVFGDALCNFADGVFVGFALLQCDMSIVWTVTAAALYHEITQEVADYFLLTKHAGLSPVKAIILNFVGGLTIVLGGIVVFSSDVSGMGVGVGLAIACGVYISIACCECLPRVRAVVETRQERALSMLCFIIGVVPLGIVLLNHIHCDAHGDEHEDH